MTAGVPAVIPPEEPAEKTLPLPDDEEERERLLRRKLYAVEITARRSLSAQKAQTYLESRKWQKWLIIGSLFGGLGTFVLVSIAVWGAQKFHEMRENQRADKAFWTAELNRLRRAHAVEAGIDPASIPEITVRRPMSTAWHLPIYALVALTVLPVLPVALLEGMRRSGRIKGTQPQPDLKTALERAENDFDHWSNWWTNGRMRSALARFVPAVLPRHSRLLFPSSTPVPMSAAVSTESSVDTSATPERTRVSSRDRFARALRDVTSIQRVGDGEVAGPKQEFLKKLAFAVGTEPDELVKVLAESATTPAEKRLKGRLTVLIEKAPVDNAQGEGIQDVRAASNFFVAYKARHGLDDLDKDKLGRLGITDSGMVSRILNRLSKVGRTSDPFLSRAFRLRPT